MNWEMLSAVGQLAAVFIGIPSLIYLAIQIREQTEERRQSAVNTLTTDVVIKATKYFDKLVVHLVDEFKIEMTVPRPNEWVWPRLSQMQEEMDAMEKNTATSATGRGPSSSTSEIGS